MGIYETNRPAEIVIVGSAAVVKSGMKLEVWKKALGYDPDLGLYDKDEKQVYRVRIEKGLGSMTKNEIVFSEIPDYDGFAVATLILDAEAADKKKLVSEQYGMSILRLIEVEKSLSKVLEEAEETEKLIAGSIRFV